jgi:hypothetical protein
MQISIAVKALMGDHRLLLSGTPIQVWFLMQRQISIDTEAAVIATLTVLIILGLPSRGSSAVASLLQFAAGVE